MKQCVRCLEDNEQLFYLGECRRCLSFPFAEDVEISVWDDFEKTITLMPWQDEISAVLAEKGVHESMFIDAVCGAGKTEICLELIERCFREGKRVAWTVPRREVVLELAARLQSYYPSQSIIPVCGGHTDKTIADLVVCTTHQLFRYYQYFDVLILDEPDAFPYAGNEILERILHTSCRGTIIYLSATFSIDHVKRLELSIRPSGVLLPVPEIKRGYFLLIRLILDLSKYSNESCLVFVPTKKLARKLSHILRSPMITSDTEDKQSPIDTFRQSGGILIATTVLERGVTFPECFVFVYCADHITFNEGSLVQISGRALRGMKPKKGKVIFYCLEINQDIQKAIKRITAANNSALSVLKNHPKTNLY